MNRIHLTSVLAQGAGWGLVEMLAAGMTGARLVRCGEQGCEKSERDERKDGVGQGCGCVVAEGVLLGGLMEAMERLEAVP